MKKEIKLNELMVSKINNFVATPKDLVEFVLSCKDASTDKEDINTTALKDIKINGMEIIKAEIDIIDNVLVLELEEKTNSIPTKYYDRCYNGEYVENNGVLEFVSSARLKFEPTHNIQKDNPNCKIHERRFEDILFHYYNIYGDIACTIKVTFNLYNSTITVNGNTIKVKESNEKRDYRILKTCIKANNGINGLYKYFIDAMHCNSRANSSCYYSLCKVGGINE